VGVGFEGFELGLQGFCLFGFALEDAWCLRFYQWVGGSGPVSVFFVL
jgi:hypothetical protein